MNWATFVRTHAHLIAAADFFTTEVWTVRGLVRHFTLFVIDIAARHVHVAGTTANPTSAWMEQTARNLTDCEDGFLTGRRFLILDRDAIFSPGFKSIVGDSGVEHQGIGNEMISGAEPQSKGNVDVRERLGGLLKYYHREAAQPNRVFGHYGFSRRSGPADNRRRMVSLPGVW